MDSMVHLSIVIEIQPLLDSRWIRCRSDMDYHF